MSVSSQNEQWRLGEGQTPLVASVAHHQLGPLYFKLESTNPTGSYKDRFVAAEVREMLQKGVKACVATSSGNTGSSLATYCTRAGLRCAIVVNESAPEGKLRQMSAHGAWVLRVPGFTTDPVVTRGAFATLEALASAAGIPLVVSAFAYCPVGMTGVESIAAELLAINPDHVFVPVGGGGLYSAIAQGFVKAGKRMPRVHAVQPGGCLTLVGAYLLGGNTIPIPISTTTVSGLSVPGNLDSTRGLALLRLCGGTGIAVGDAEVFAAQEELFLREGIYSEPAGATAFAGWKRAVKAGTVKEGESSICLVTGHGFKDPESARRIAAHTPARLVQASDLHATILKALECGNG